MDGIRGLGSLRDPSVCMRGGILHEVALAFRLRRALGGRFALGLAFLAATLGYTPRAGRPATARPLVRFSPRTPFPMQALTSKSMKGTPKTAATP